MKTKTTLKALAFCIIAYGAALLSSCSTSSQLSSQKTHYHLNLVKADTHSLPSDKTKNDNTTADIVPISGEGSLTGYQSVNQPKELNELLKTDMKVSTKHVKKTNPEIYQQLKSINMPKTLRQLTDKSFKTGSLSTSRIAEHGEHHYLSLWVTFLIISLVFFIFTYAIPILYIFGLIAFIAAVIFFILWIAALAS